jgi:predicted hotdog family 3-hydroxylacyl-ACP dehydratase
MIGKLLEVTENKTVTSMFINEDNLFCEEGLFRELGLIENMAQTAAAGIGYISKKTGAIPPIGFIGGLKNLYIHELPKVGSQIRTEVIVEHRVFNATVVNGKIFLDDRCIAECELKIFLINDK